MAFVHDQRTRSSCRECRDAASANQDDGAWITEANGEGSAIVDGFQHAGACVVQEVQAQAGSHGCDVRKVCTIGCCKGTAHVGELDEVGRMVDEILDLGVGDDRSTIDRE